MQFFRFLLGLLFKMRDVIQKKGSDLFNKVRNEETGKIVGFRPDQVKSILIIVFFVFFVGIIISKVFSSNDFIAGGSEDYKKELTPDSFTGDRSDSFNGQIGNDPLSTLGSLLGRKNGDSALDLLSDGEGSSDFSGKPSETECIDLMEKMRANIPLNDEEKVKFKTCLDENIGGFTANDIEIARRLLEGDLSPEERELLRQLLAGELDPDSEEYALAKALLAGGERAALARAALRARKKGKNQIYDTIVRSLQGEQLSPEEKGLMARLRKALGTKANKTSDGLNLTGDLSKQIEDLTKDIAGRENAINDLEFEVARAQALAAKAGEKLAKGLPLTKEEQDAISNLAKLQEKLRALKDLQSKRKTLLGNLMNDLRKTLARASETLKDIYPSGVVAELNDYEDVCKDPSPFVAKKKKKKKVGKSRFAKKSRKEIWLDPNGRKLTPDEIRIIKLARLKKQNDQQDKDDLLNPGNTLVAQNDIGSRLTPNIGGEGGQTEFKIDDSFIYQNESKKDFALTPDMKIPAVIESQILVSDKGSGQIVRIRILDDVRDPASQKIILPKNSIATGRTQGFDADTALMAMTFDKVVVGAGKVLDVKLQLGSADGTMGLKGQVRDTRGKFLLGTFVTAFSAGALNWFSQQVVTPFLDDTDIQGGFSGAALGGGAEVATQIAELYAGDLQNAAKVFWAPRGIPVVLFPN